MSVSNRDEWEENMLKEMTKVFSEMGMNVDINMLKSIMNQLKGRLEDMGMNMEDMAKANVNMDVNKMNINFDPKELRKMMEQMMNINNPEGFGDLLKNIGVDVKLDEPVIEMEAEINDAPDDEELDQDNVQIYGDKMYLTVDISRYADINQDSMELNLASSGNLLQIMKTTQLRPFKKFKLPETASRIIKWTYNNGILDVTFDINSTMYN
ncbi:MAG: HSP20 family molecular chaperone IbpA [Candidatus Thalassarchaeaceae archaeon]|jgi:HSP20 family molecular chaperone IbpA